MKNIFAISVIITGFLFAQPEGPDFWELTNGPFVAKVNAFVVSSNGNIYCGSYLEGVFRSIDNGNTWHYLGFGGSIVAVVTMDSGHVYVGTATDGLHHFTDLNEEWIYIDNNSPSSDLTCLAVDLEGKILVGTRSEGLYISGENGGWSRTGAFFEGRISTIFTDTLNGYIYAGTDSLFRSSGSPYNWLNTSLRISRWRNSVAINLDNSILVSTYDNGIHSSTDNANSWQQLTTINAEILSINSKGNIFAGDYYDGIYRSTDSGNNWSQINDGLTYSVDVKAIFIDSNDNIFAGTGGGIYYSANDGNNWRQKNNGLGEDGKPNSLVSSICSAQNNELFVGTQFGGVYKSTNRGETWIPFNNGLPNNVPVYSMIYNSDNQLFAATFVGIYTLKNKDTLWLKTEFELRANALTINSNDTILASANDGLYISGDNGENWTKSALPDGISINTLEYDRNDYLWAATNNSIYISGDNGSKWEKIDSSKSYVRCIAISDNNTIFISANEGLYRSFNNGTSWEKVLVSPLISSMIITSSGAIYAGSYGEGIHKSIDNGDNWEDISQGLRRGWITKLVIDSAGYIFAGLGSRELMQSTGGGVARSINSVTSVKEETAALNIIDNSHIIVQNYPNPFNSSTNIQFNIPRTSLVNLKIFDIGGKEMSVLINNKKMSAGQHIYLWNAEKFSAGIYFVRLTINNADKKVQKMIYLK